jgi:hypothetical protein
VGAGSSQDAPFTLVTKVPAGTYQCILDAIVVDDVTITFDLIWRHGSGSGTSDTTLVEWNESYTPLASGIDAQPFEYDEAAPAIDPEEGDQLVFRYASNATSAALCYIPNGDGSLEKGRIPNFTLPTVAK